LPIRGNYTFPVRWAENPLFGRKGLLSCFPWLGDHFLNLRPVNSPTTSKIVSPRLEGMSDALRQELMIFGIDAVIIEPDTVNTAMYDAYLATWHK
jgi:hypothetical protein